MDIANSDILIPAAIVGVCMVVALVTWRLTRHRTKGWELGELGASAERDDLLIDIDALDRWSRDYAPTVAAWIAAHEETLATLGRTGLQLDLTERAPGVDTALDVSMRKAITAHPTPAVRAQLSAMAVSAEATLTAVRRSNYETAERQHIAYVSYRNQWRSRLGPPKHPAEGQMESDRPLRAVPDADPVERENQLDESSDPAPPDEALDSAGTITTEPDTAEFTGSDASIEDAWQITRPRKARRKSHRAG